jgi:hypothetical protein
MELVSSNSKSRREKEVFIDRKQGNNVESCFLFRVSWSSTYSVVENRISFWFCCCSDVRGKYKVLLPMVDGLRDWSSSRNELEYDEETKEFKLKLRDDYSTNDEVRKEEKKRNIFV